MTTNIERREYFRIRDRLPVEFRKISADEFSKLQDVIRYNATQVTDKINEVYFLRERMMQTENDQTSVIMSIINKKLDMIIDLLYQSKKSDTHYNRLIDVIISGSGIQFESDVLIHENDYVELKVVLPVFPYPTITALCQTIRSDVLEKNGFYSYDVAMRFLVINEKDRDLLINYVFLKERERVRLLKETAS
ncbi:MAG: hypothetical protein A4E64_01221 [Syntrophorhabdus sp. PtaU1.Bin058]|nr:MAG: hypothetical protein A4E64_01221 [Syntrophorhabdus sp. PtaU1.Bin058]